MSVEKPSPSALATAPFRPEDELAAFAVDDAGAVASFTGLCRPATKGGRPVERLFLDHHPRLTERSLEKYPHRATLRIDMRVQRSSSR